MKVSEKSAPTAAIVAALSTLACCVPLGFLGAVGLAGVSVWAQHYRLWLLTASIAFLGVGSAQLYFRKSCVRRSTTRARKIYFHEYSALGLEAVGPVSAVNVEAYSLGRVVEAGHLRRIENWLSSGNLERSRPS